MTYILALYLVLGGQYQMLVVDWGLTLADCVAEVRDNPGTQMACLPEDEADREHRPHY